MMKSLARAAVIGKTVYRYALMPLAGAGVRHRTMRRLLARLPQSSEYAAETAPVRLRLALESLYRFS